jgi:hypothetical protein
MDIKRRTQGGRVIWNDPTSLELEILPEISQQKSQFQENLETFLQSAHIPAHVDVRKALEKKS